MIFFQAVAHQFSGYALDADYLEAAKYLKLVAEQNEEDIDSSYYYSAGYDSPYVIFNRRNEVWYTKN